MMMDDLFGVRIQVLAIFMQNWQAEFETKFRGHFSFNSVKEGEGALKGKRWDLFYSRGFMINKGECTCRVSSLISNC
jgi:hypothetical protein